MTYKTHIEISKGNNKSLVNDEFASSFNSHKVGHLRPFGKHIAPFTEWLPPSPCFRTEIKAKSAHKRSH